MKESRDFARLKRDGKRLASGCLLANWQIRPEALTSRLGVVTSRKLGNAVVRNRARRLLREVFRSHRNELVPRVDLVLVARQSIVGKHFADVESDFLTMVRKAGLCQQLNRTG